MRALDIRLKDARFVDLATDLTSGLTAWHGSFAGIGVSQRVHFSEIVSTCSHFLRYHRKEIIFMFIKKEIGNSIEDWVDGEIEKIRVFGTCMTRCLLRSRKA